MSKETKKRIGLGVSVMLAAFLIAVMGCGSSPSPSASQQSSFDPQQLVGIWLNDQNQSVNELTINPDYTGIWKSYTVESQPRVIALFEITNDGKMMSFPDGSDSIPINFQEGKIIFNGKTTFSKAQPANVAGTVWVQENNAFEITYTFSNDGTYKIGYGGIAVITEFAQLYGILKELKNAGIDGTGTYTVSDHLVILKPKGGTYIVPTPPGKFEKKQAETYTLVFVNGNELFYGYYYEKK